jgi:hypothetical protein
MTLRPLPALLASLVCLSGAPRAELLGLALEAANLGGEDLAFPLLPAERDALRLERVEEILIEGLRLDAWADSLCRELEPVDQLGELYRLLRAELRRAGDTTPPPPLAPLPAGGTSTWRGWRERLQGLARLRFLDEPACAALEQDLRGLLSEDEDLPRLTVFELDSLERASRLEAAARKGRLEGARLPDPAALEQALAGVDALFLELNALRHAALELPAFEHPRWGRLRWADEWVAVGDTAANHWQGDLPPIVIDLGGDDRWSGPVAVARGGFSLVIDMDGDDEYRSEGDGQAFSVGGLAVLLDLGGDDRYRIRGFGQGASLGGVALLIDQAGDDLYEGDSFCQGAGSLGIGALVDGGGRDLYDASTYAQGFGHLAGFGLLQDLGGHDSYLLRARYLDQIRYDDRFVTLGQGFGFGLRPDLSGGIGLLHDLEGNDLYNCDIYGQGAAYWWALGALVDRGGHDRYIGHQYAQGAGVHLAAGLLLDGGGNDVYSSRGVSQGCGHDLALGLLADRGGDDSYLSWDLSQGAGNANGTGLLVDEQGEDLYAMRSLAKPRAWGDSRRRTGSLGLFVDGGGRDHYLGGGGEDSLWTAGRRGFGFDLDRAVPPGQSAAPSAQQPAAALDPLFNPGDTVERLYVWAIRLEPRWAAERDAARSALQARIGEFQAFLRRSRALETQASWERHALNDMLKRQGEAAWPLLAEAVSAGEREARGLALWVLSERDGQASADSLLAWWERPGLLDTPGQRATLLEILARQGLGREPLLTALDDSSAAVRRSAAWGLGRLPGDASLRLALLRRLGDDALPVREAARASLLADEGLSLAQVEGELAGLGGGEGRRLVELLELLAGRWPEALVDWLPRLRGEPGGELLARRLRQQAARAAADTGR